jgi:hypothetical protein
MKRPARSQGRPASGGGLPAEILAELERFEPEDRRHLSQVLERESELRREMVIRALQAGHSPAELLSFAHALRDLSEEEVFTACTGGPVRGTGSVETRLKAEADPFLAFLLNGHALDKRPAVELGASAGAVPSGATTITHAVSAEGARAFRLSAALRLLALSYEERRVGKGGLSLGDALDRALEALGRGLLVPAVLGEREGDLRQDVLLVQVDAAPGKKAVQLHDVTEGQTVWVHTNDLRSGTELRLANRRLRRLTAVYLPRAQP